jgi:hypothetical protein
VVPSASSPTAVPAATPPAPTAGVPAGARGLAQAALLESPGGDPVWQPTSSPVDLRVPCSYDTDGAAAVRWAAWSDAAGAGLRQRVTVWPSAGRAANVSSMAADSLDRCPAAAVPGAETSVVPLAQSLPGVDEARAYELDVAAAGSPVVHHYVAVLRQGSVVSEVALSRAVPTGAPDTRSGFQDVLRQAAQRLELATAGTVR